MLHMFDMQDNFLFWNCQWEEREVPDSRLRCPLLTKAQAASYCGLNVAAFSVLSPVRPIALDKEKRFERLTLSLSTTG